MKFRSKRDFELHIVEMFQSQGQISKRNYKEITWSPMTEQEEVHNLWLYYVGDVHIGTWDSSARSGWTFKVLNHAE